MVQKAIEVGKKVFILPKYLSLLYSFFVVRKVRGAVEVYILPGKTQSRWKDLKKSEKVWVEKETNNETRMSMRGKSCK